MNKVDCQVCCVELEELEASTFGGKPICRYCYCAYEQSRRMEMVSCATLTNFFNVLEKRLIKEIREGKIK